MQAAYRQLMYDATLRDDFVAVQQLDTSSVKVKDDSLNSVQRAMASVPSNQTTVSDSGAGMDIESTVQDTVKFKPDSYVEGYEMTPENVPEVESGSVFSVTGSEIMASLLVLAGVGAIYLGFWKRK